MYILLHADPKTLSSGSSGNAPARCGAETQHVQLSQLHYHLYVVFTSAPVTRPAGVKKVASLIPAPWYTSGKLLYARKSDLTGTAIR